MRIYRYIILQVTNHQITMHLEGDMTVVGSLTVEGHLDQLGINYVTAVNPEASREQIVHYCESVKYEPVTVKDEFQRLHERLSVEPTTHVIENNVSYYSDMKKIVDNVSFQREYLKK